MIECRMANEKLRNATSVTAFHTTFGDTTQQPVAGTNAVIPRGATPKSSWKKKSRG